jgi:hypothetical protein
MIPQGRTIICSLCVQRLPNMAWILWIPVSGLSGHDDGSSCASPTSISSISSAVNTAASESMGLATLARCSLPHSWKNAVPCCVCRFSRAACSGMSQEDQWLMLLLQQLQNSLLLHRYGGGYHGQGSSGVCCWREQWGSAGSRSKDDQS